MYLQTFLIFATLQLSFGNRPIVFLKDNTVITNNRAREYLPQNRQFIPSQYPYYEVITTQEEVPTITAPSPEVTDLPLDLIEIARTKLGIQNIEEVPSVSELGELLGTTSRAETLKLLRQLAATESGIDLIKAFIESSDYTDNTEEKEPVPIEADTSGPFLPTSLISETNQKNLEVIQKVLTTPKPELGFFQRVSSYFNVFDLFPKNKDTPFSPANKEVQELSHTNHHGTHSPRHPNLPPVSVANYISNSISVPHTPNHDRFRSPPPSTYNKRLEEQAGLNRWSNDLE